MTSRLSSTRSLAVLVVTALVAVVTVLVLSGPQAAAGARRVSERTYDHYLRELRHLAKQDKGFGYFNLFAHRTIKLGFVGETPADVAAKIKEAPEGVVMSNERSLYTHRQLKKAQRVAWHSSYDLNESWMLGRGRGIAVGTEDEQLLASHNPRRLLGVHVSVLVFYAEPATAL